MSNGKMTWGEIPRLKNGNFFLLEYALTENKLQTYGTID